jgi:rhomboid protease GluP
MLVALNLIFGFMGSGIDIWGHIGGLAGGFLMTMALLQGEGEDKRLAQRIGSGAAFALIAGFILMNHGMFNVLIGG